MIKQTYTDKFNKFLEKIDKKEIEVSELIDFTDVISIRKIVNSQNQKMNSEQFSMARREILVRLNNLKVLCIARQDESELDKKIDILYQTSKKSFSVLPYLLSKHNKKLTINEDDVVKTFDTENLILADIKNVIKKSGLSKLFMDSQTKDLASYVYGVEAGLWSNNKKNQTGKNFENKILGKFVENDISVVSQFNSSNLTNDPFDTTKLIDFVVKTDDGPTYLIEVNYYNAAGSKLNEIAKSYTHINRLVNNANQLDPINQNVFIWITDGPGWMKTKNGLSKAFENIEHLYTTSDFDQIVRMIKNKSMKKES